MIFIRNKKSKKDYKSEVKEGIEEMEKDKVSKYRTKRCKANITPYTMAKELGIPYWKYMEVDRGKRPLEGKYVDNFNDIIENAREVNLKRAERMMKVRPFIYNRELLNKKMKEYGVDYKSLAKILGFAPNTLVCISNKNRSSSDDLKEIVYDWLNEPMNKRIKNNEVSTSELVQNEANNERKVDDNINIQESDENSSDDTKNVKNDDNADEEKKDTKINIDFENATKNEKVLMKVIISLNEDNDRLLEDNRKIIDELNKCRHQIAMYEKLIERL